LAPGWRNIFEGHGNFSPLQLSYFSDSLVDKLARKLLVLSLEGKVLSAFDFIAL
jgi:hypothetical protein